MPPEELYFNAPQALHPTLPLHLYLLPTPPYNHKLIVPQMGVTFN